MKQNTSGVILSVHVICVVILCVIMTTAAGDDKLPFMSQFPSDVNQLGRSRPSLGGNQFQYLHIRWIRQQQFPDARAISVMVDAQENPRPRIVWIINGQMIQETDQQYPQVTSLEYPQVKKQRFGFYASINISNTIEVSSLRLLLSLHTIETETEIQLQNLNTGRIILEHATDVALALNLQENVTTSSNADLVFTARFFAEDLPESTLDELHVHLVQDGGVLTPELNSDVLTLRRPAQNEVHGSLHRRFDSPLSRHYMLRVGSGHAVGTVMFTAEYDTGAPCRLFGGQNIIRRVFLSSAAK
ncbi:uncharacterized protein [Littorina saxatilis]|uniref:uncharacterized protein n=1 Tax=Littorina saxatilis TaxID=31220 RepID=UPI0038B42098